MIQYNWQIGSNFNSIKTGDYVENDPAVPVRVWRRLKKEGVKLDISDQYTMVRPNAKIWANEDLLPLKRN